MTGDRKALIRYYNDQLRISGEGGQTVMTVGVNALPGDVRQQALRKIQVLFVFTGEEDDPYEEHDFGEVKAGGYKLYWKIDYYDKNVEYGSEDPADPDVTHRVMTIMLAEEY